MRSMSAPTVAVRCRSAAHCRPGSHRDRRSGAIRRDGSTAARLRTQAFRPMASPARTDARRWLSPWAYKVGCQRPIFGYAEADPAANTCWTFSPAVSAKPKAATAIRCRSAVATTPIALPARGLVQHGFNEVAPGREGDLRSRHATSQKPPDSRSTVNRVHDGPEHARESELGIQRWRMLLRRVP